MATINVSDTISLSENILIGRNKYWVGGTGNYSDDTDHWALTSGGASAAGNLPSLSDNVHFDSNSNTTAYTVTIDTNSAVCNNFSVDAAPSVSGTVTLADASPNTLGVYGTFTLLSGMTWSGAGNLQFHGNGGSGSVNVKANGVTVAAAASFNGIGTWLLSNNWNTTATGNFTVGDGTHAATVITNNNTIGASTLAINNNGTLTAGSSTLTLNAFSANTGASATLSSTTLTIGSTTGGNGSFAGNGFTFGSVTITVNGASPTMTGANTFSSLTLSGSATTDATYAFASNQTVTGTFTATGNSSVNRLIVSSSTIGTSVTVAAGAASLSNIDFEDVTGAGAAAPWTGTSLGDCGGNSGITMTPAITVYAYGGASNMTWTNPAQWFLATGGTGGAGRVPLPQDNSIFDANTFSTTGLTVSTSYPRMGNNITFTGVASGTTWNVTANTYFGSLTMGSGMSMIGSAIMVASRGAVTLTTAGVTLNGIQQNFSGPNGTVTQLDSLTVAQTIRFGILSGNNWIANGFNITSPNFNLNGSGSFTMGSGTFTATGTGPVWNFPNVGSVSGGTSTIIFSDTSSSTKTFKGDGQTYYNLVLAGGSGGGSYSLLDGDTFNNIQDTGTAAHSVLFTSGTTTTVGSFSVSGTSPNQITLAPVSGTTTYALVSNGGKPINTDWLNIQHSVATPSNTWFTGLNSTNNQGVATAGSGWIFNAVGISVSDSITETESLNTNEISYINVSDTESDTDTVNVSQVYDVNVSDSITEAESIGLLLLSYPSVSDSIIDTDTANATLVFDVGVLDTIIFNDSGGAKINPGLSPIYQGFSNTVFPFSGSGIISIPTLGYSR